MNAGWDVIFDARDVKVEMYAPGGSSGFMPRHPVGVRVTHLPTGLSTECASDRSAHRNKAIALEALQKKVEVHVLAPPRLQRNRPGELAYIQQQAEQLITYAARLGIVVTIEQQPRQPLSMGRYDSVASVRFARSTNTE